MWALLSALIFLAIPVYLILAEKKPPRGIPPSLPFRRYPFFGQLFDLYPHVKSGYFYDLTAKHHKALGGIFTAELFSLPWPFAPRGESAKLMIFVSDTLAAKEILNSKKAFTRNKYLGTLMTGAGRHMLFVIPSGDVWKKHRKLMQPAFGFAHVKSAADLTTKVALEMVACWDRLLERHTAGEEPVNVNIDNNFSRLTLDVIGLIAFSHPFRLVPNICPADGENASDAALPDLEAFADMFACANNRVGLSPILWPFFNVGVKEMEKPASRIRPQILKVIREKKQRREAKSDADTDMLDRLIDASTGVGSVSMTEEELIDETFGIFLAGSETTAHSLTFCVLAMCLHPDICRKLEESIDEAYPFPPSDERSLPTWDTINDTPYVDAFIKEVLRFYSIASQHMRYAAEDTTLTTKEGESYHIPKGSAVNITVSDIHLDPESYPNPTQFDPTRFLPSDDPSVPVQGANGSFLAFGDGPMNCIGQKIALMEMKVALVVLIKRFRFSLVPGQDLKPRISITTGLKNGCRVYLTRRS